MGTGSLTSWWRETPPPNCLQDPTRFYLADFCNVEAFHDCLLNFSMCPVMHRRSNLVQFRWPLVLTDLFPLWWALNSAPCLCLQGFTWVPLWEVIAIGSLDDSRDTMCLLPVPSVNAAPGDIFKTLWQIRDFLWRALHSLGWWKWTKEKPMSVSDGSLTKQKRWPHKKYSGLKHARRESKRKEIKSLTISTHGLGSEWKKKIYCILL